MADASDPVAPETDAKELTPPAAPPVARRRSTFLPLLAGGVLAAAMGYGAAQVWPLVQGDSRGLQTDVAELKVELARLSEAPDVSKALADRIAALESASAPDLAPLLARVDGLEQALAQLKARPSPADPAALAGLQAQIDLLKQGGVPAAAIADVQAAFDAQLAEAESRLAEVKAAAEAIATTSAQRATVLQLRAALDSGTPYSGALAGLAGLSIPPVLAEHDAAGLPTLQSLRADFPEAARAALDAALRANMGESWAERVSNFLMNQTGARSLTPREGNDPDAILSRAEAALTAGDLAAALTEIAALPPEAQTAMEAWIAAAKLRQDAVQAVQSLSDAAGL